MITSASVKKISAVRCLRAGSASFFGTRPADVRQHEPEQHPERVLDREEPQGGIRHRCADVPHAFLDDRAQAEIEQQADQELQIQHADENRARAVVAGRPVA